MKITELMIGDLVRDTRESYISVAKITGINAHQAYERNPVCFLEYEEDTGVKLGIIRQPSELCPISLTREILEKNGFNSYTDISQDWFIGVFKSEDHYIELTYSKGNIEWTINGDEYRIADLKYVHELQHILKICGINKEIVL